MFRFNTALIQVSLLVFVMSGSQIQAGTLPYRNDTKVWHAPQDMHHSIKDVTGGTKRTRIHTLCKSPANHDLLLLEIAPAGSQPSHKNIDGPAILVVGNPLGDSPLGTEGALSLARYILSDDAGPAAGKVRWYILPCANPDGATRFFQAPLNSSGRNTTPIDDDKDGEFAEDGPDDLDDDGLISQMLLADPEGTWILTDEIPARARKAKPSQGETGLYRLLVEGFDNDNDGLWNEDDTGGVICGRNFPHRFEHWTTTAGLWAGDQPESRAILDFAFSHPSIAMVLVFGSHDNLMVVPEIKIKEIQKDPVQAINDYHAQDMPWWKQFSEDYREAVFDTITPGKLADAKKSVAGSLEEWAYFQFGVPAFAVSFWNVPLFEEGKADSNAVDKSVPRADQITESLIEFSNKNNWPGYITWTPAQLPDGREVFVGGEAPFARTTPPPALVDSLLAARIPFLASLPGRLPVLGIKDIELSPRGSDVYELTVWVSNEGDLDYPTGQGSLCLRVPPVIISLEGGKIMEGRNRTKVEKLPAHQSVPVRWLVQAQPGLELKIFAGAPSLGQHSQSITVNNKGGQR